MNTKSNKSLVFTSHTGIYFILFHNKSYRIPEKVHFWTFINYLHSDFSLKKESEAKKALSHVNRKGSCLGNDDAGVRIGLASTLLHGPLHSCFSNKPMFFGERETAYCLSGTWDPGTLKWDPSCGTLSGTRDPRWDPGP